jgi:hypothetical protein
MSSIQKQSLENCVNSGEALEAASKLADAVEQEKQAAFKLVGPTVDRLLGEFDMIQEHEKQAAFDRLNDHAGTLQVLNQVLTAYGELQKQANQAQALSPGKPVPRDKQASDASEKSRNSNYVGQRLGGNEKSAADLALIKGLNLDSELLSR